MALRLPHSRGIDALPAWYFVVVWGSGFLATKIGLQHAPPFTVQPLLTGLLAARWLHEPLAVRQWIGIAAGLTGSL